MYERADQLWREDGEDEMDRAIANLDGETLARLIQELVEMNRRFLTVTKALCKSCRGPLIWHKPPPPAFSLLRCDRDRASQNLVKSSKKYL
jgi:hypothetical protein